MTEPSTSHWPALDGLRGLAVIGVVAFHIDRLPGGFLGVDLFFTLSGFLITTLLLREHHASDRIRLGRFWLRRFRRLLPAVMALIGIVLVWLSVWGTPAEQATSREDARWAIPYLANWHLIAVARDYWASATSASAFTHLWSLAIEEQFYLLWPLVVWWLARRPGRLAAVTVLATVASAVAMILLADRSGPTRAYMGTDTRAAALLLGALAALPAVRSATAAWTARRPRAADALFVIAVLVLATTWWLGGRDIDMLLNGGLLVHSMFAAVIVALLTAPSGGPVRSACSRALSLRMLTWVGMLSYGIYLWHWPLIMLGRPRVTGLPDLLRDLLLVTAAVVLSIVSYRLVEQPVRRQRSWARGARATLATGAFTAAATVIAVIAPSGEGSVATFDPGSVTGSTTSPSSADTPASTTRPTSTPPGTTESGTTESGTTESGRTESGTTDGPATSTTPPTTVPATAPPTTLPRTSVERVLWIGDSIAADAAPAVLAALEAGGVVAADGAFPGRRLISSDGVDAETLYPELLAEHTPDLVVLQLSLWDSPFTIEEQREAFTWFHQLVRDSGADLVLLPPPPVREDLTDPGMERQLRVAAELVADDPAHTHLLDPTVVWGTELDRDLDDDLVPDRKWDGVHICPQGAARFGLWLVAELAARFDGIDDPDPATWISGPWTADEKYDTPVGACALLEPGDT